MKKTNPYIYPLSWTQAPNIQEPQIRKSSLLFSEWLTYGSFPEHFSEEAILRFFAEQSAFALRGVRKPLLDAFVNLFPSYDFLLSGTEFLIEIPNYTPKKSLRQLIKRGEKKYIFKEITQERKTYAQALKKLLQTKQKEWKHPLKNLFITHFKLPIRIFIIQNSPGEIAGLLTISPFGKKHWHTEQILRNPSSYIGAMEFLIHQTIRVLASEGAENLSLGEVPFTQKNPLSFKNKLYYSVGQKIRFAYNSPGLAFFKNKFATHKEPVYLFANFSLDYLTLLNMFLKTELHKVIWKKSLKKINLFSRKN